MANSGSEPDPPESDPGPSHQSSLSPPQDQGQLSRATSSVHGTAGSSSTAVHDYFKWLVPIAVVERYKRAPKLKGPFIDLELDAITASFADGEEPKGWTRLVHPEGALYWVYEHLQDGRTMPVYTDAYLYDDGIREEIEKFRDEIFRKVQESSNIPAEWELVLDLADNDDPHQSLCNYYFINCSNRTLFWLHSFPLDKNFMQGLAEVNTKRRIQQVMEMYYWLHWEIFPHNREVPEKLLKELTGIMVHAGIDNMTSHGSTSIYSADELEKFISYVEKIRFVGGDDGYSACVVGRLMALFTRGRYINFFGQREARLSHDQSVLHDGHGKERSWWMTTASVLLFFAPEVQLKALDTVYVDFVVCQRKWNKYICKAQNEWRELVRIGTVFLTANVAFLAIPSIDTAGAGSSKGIGMPRYSRNPVQVMSYMSIVFSMGCMVIGQLLLRHHMIRPRNSAEDVDRYLRAYTEDKRRGLERLAILYSIPYALLLWSIAAFFVAFVFVTLVDSAGRWQRYPTVAVTVIFIALLIWCSLETWGERPILGSVFRFLSSSSKSDQSQGPPYQPTTAQPEQHDNQGARRLSVRIDPKSVAD